MYYSIWFLFNQISWPDFVIFFSPRHTEGFLKDFEVPKTTSESIMSAIAHPSRGSKFARVERVLEAEYADNPHATP